MKNKLYVLHGSLNNVEKVYTNYLEYLNTKDTEFRDNLIVPLIFLGWPFATWGGDNTFPKETPYYNKLYEVHRRWVRKTTLDNLDKTPESFLKNLNFFKEVYTRMFFIEASKYSWTDDNLREKVIALTGYNSNNGKQDFPERFIERLRKLDLVNKFSKGA